MAAPKHYINTKVGFSVRNLLVLLKKSNPTRAEITWMLQTIFKLSFWLKTSLTLIISPVPILLLQVPKETNPIIEQALLTTEFLLLPISLLVAHLFAIKGGKEAALASVISLAALLASSIWIMLFAYLIGIRGMFLVSFLLIPLGYYALGPRLAKNYVKVFFKNEERIL